MAVLLARFLSGRGWVLHVALCYFNTAPSNSVFSNDHRRCAHVKVWTEWSAIKCLSVSVITHLTPQNMLKMKETVNVLKWSWQIYMEILVELEVMPGWLVSSCLGFCMQVARQPKSQVSLFLVWQLSSDLAKKKNTDHVIHTGILYHVCLLVYLEFYCFQSLAPKNPVLVTISITTFDPPHDWVAQIFSIHKTFHNYWYPVIYF